MKVDDIALHDDMQPSELQDDILYLILSQSELAKELTGVIIKGKRPNRKEFAIEEDCTIGSLPMPAGSVQIGTSNVNIYVPDVPSIATGNNAQGYEQNGKRIKQLKAMAYKILKKYYCENGWSFETVEQGTLEEADIHCHRIWLKIRFTFHN